MERWASKLLIFGLPVAGLLLWLYYWYDPALYAFPKCPFLLITGYKCPGCGSQRALHLLLHGEMGAAGRMNPLFLLALPYVLFGLVLEYSGWGKRQFVLRSRWYGYTATRLVLAVVLVFWAARTLWHF